MMSDEELSRRIAEARERDEHRTDVLGEARIVLEEIEQMSSRSNQRDIKKMNTRARRAREIIEELIEMRS